MSSLTLSTVLRFDWLVGRDTIYYTCQALGYECQTTLIHDSEF